MHLLQMECLPTSNLSLLYDRLVSLGLVSGSWPSIPNWILASVALDSKSATGLSFPCMCLMSVVKSEI